MVKRDIRAAVMTALLLTAAIPGTAQAGETSAGQLPDSAVIDVRAKYEGDMEVPAVYLVDVKWGAMEFTYTSAGTSIWDPVTHTYKVTEKNTWSGQGNTITLENHSNAEVTAELSFRAAEGYSLTGNFDRERLTLPSAEGTEAGAPPSAEAVFMLDGTLEAETDSFHTVGQITVAVK
ncbi:hypothetical protein BRYFOR_09122 [Marvinbryantia formatexigens DSM 14469]|uniref:Uncharacterized protein n=1 Tax=Marvinbryantia formatexigens DSM 14469 TaxID=478749 RepID=C6LKD5_9FIRM|nr:hypothetical protein [Marvinbryantia formatexigens]EET58834.1 hypothetical protein BRYFOR_09122 [Marvinbryantia formatexigens DSM 14469]UWO26753.1 hypothetical protein NQ534_10040 [Marvinbryantia formatexigens DSM 14469]SDG86725.1 hypothetical protein SAMN05660368_03416 [Marvinbryantia formatexigens]